ncbi:AMP-binding protein [Tardiphaga sp.]|jgi:acyl-CoA synthetase (AMP-forming)/AMP-acid ligase II|uniref:AMP-binding protein n=1 Tax=Tardiphaga sp. TaxID=1926292 RepID=UPI0037DA69E0
MRGLMMDTPLLLTDMLRHAAIAHGATEVVSRMIDGGIHRYSYRQALDRCRRLSAALAAFDLAPGDRIGSLAWNTHHHFELFYGIPGQGYVLHTLNPRLHEDTLVQIITHAEDTWIFIDAATLPLAELLAPRLPQIRGWIYMDATETIPQTSLGNVISYEALISSQPPGHQWPILDENAASIMCYTSGTTGAPKGIVYSHRSIVLASLFMSMADMVGGYRGGHRETVMPVAPLFHANGWMMPFTAPMNGQKLVLPGRNFEADRLCDLIQSEEVTVVAAVPTVWLAIAAHLDTANTALPSLRAAMVAGTKAPRSLVENLERRGISVGQVWGMTEAAGGVRATPAPGVADLAADEQFARKMRQGRIGFGTELRIMSDTAEPLPHDGIALGHLEARGPCVSSGYYKLDHPVSNGWLTTGDVARIHADGSIEIVDRSKDVIKSGGEWISSQAIEVAVLEHPAIFQAAVIAMHHDRWQERPLLVAVGKPGATVTSDDLLDHLRTRIPKWWMPDQVVFIDALPVTASGKVRKAELRETLMRDQQFHIPQPPPTDPLPSAL